MLLVQGRRVRPGSAWLHEAVYIVKLQLADEKQVSDDAGWNVKRTSSASKNIIFKSCF